MRQSTVLAEPHNGINEYREQRCNQGGGGTGKVVLM